MHCLSFLCFFFKRLSDDEKNEMTSSVALTLPVTFIVLVKVVPAEVVYSPILLNDVFVLLLLLLLYRYIEGTFGVKFTEGSDYLDRGDPNWYKGTYWGECLEYNKKNYIYVISISYAI